MHSKRKYQLAFTTQPTLLETSIASLCFDPKIKHLDLPLAIKSCAVSSEQCTRLGKPLLSILLATFIVSPSRKESPLFRGCSRISFLPTRTFPPSAATTS